MFWVILLPTCERVPFYSSNPKLLAWISGRNVQISSLPICFYFIRVNCSPIFIFINPLTYLRDSSFDSGHLIRTNIIQSLHSVFLSLEDAWRLCSSNFSISYETLESRSILQTQQIWSTQVFLFWGMYFSSILFQIFMVAPTSLLYFRFCKLVEFLVKRTFFLLLTFLSMMGGLLLIKAGLWEIGTN